MSRADQSHYVRHAIGLDVGGTKIAGGVIDADGHVIERLRPIVSPANERDGTLAALSAAIADLRSRHPALEAIGVGAAGMIDWPTGHIRWAPNNAYRDLPLRQLLQESTGLPTVVDNDANTAAWAEARLGRNAAYMAFLTVGTGIGGGLVLNGQLFRGKTGIGAEVGHLVIDPDGDQRCGCGNVGCLEALASGTALGRYGREEAISSPTGLLAALAGGGEHVTGETVLAAARQADPTALALFQKVGHWLGVGIASLVNLYDFELIVIGGGVADAGELLFAPARASFSKYLFAPDHRQPPEIAAARLGVDAGWIGAAILALDESLDAGMARRRRTGLPPQWPGDYHSARINPD
jgi:glucokinase